MIYVLKKTISVSFLSEISAVRKDRFTVGRDLKGIGVNHLPPALKIGHTPGENGR